MIRHWVVLDLDVFRRCVDDAQIRREIQDNRDGTHFIAYDIRSFPLDLIVATSPTMALALKDGIGAVQVLDEQERQRRLDEYWRQRIESDPPPNLQTLVSKYGSYSNIPAEAWAEWDRLNAVWQARRRAQL